MRLSFSISNFTLIFPTRSGDIESRLRSSHLCRSLRISSLASRAFGRSERSSDTKWKWVHPQLHCPSRTISMSAVDFPHDMQMNNIVKFSTIFQVSSIYEDWYRIGNTVYFGRLLNLSLYSEIYIKNTIQTNKNTTASIPAIIHPFLPYPQTIGIGPNRMTPLL